MIIPAGFAQVNLKFTGADLPTGAEMTFGIDNQTAGDTPADIALAVADAWTTAGLPASQNVGVTLSSILVKVGPNATGPSAELAQTIPGTVTGDSDPPQTAMLVQKVTNFGGRAGRGRMYQPGVPEAFVNGAGALTGTTASIVQGLWEEFRSILEAGDHELVLLHAEGSPLSTPTPIIGLTVDGQCASQRRRNRR